MQKLPGNILVVDDDADILTAARVVLRQLFQTVDTELNPKKISGLLKQRNYDVVLLDMNYSAGRASGNEGLFHLQQILETNPDQRVVMITAYGEINLAVEAMKRGAADFIVKPWDNEKLEATVRLAYEFASAKKELKQVKNRQSQYHHLGSAPDSEFIGRSSVIKDLLQNVKKIAPTEASVLLTGENGTGKELLARHIHVLSNRAQGPFVKVDVGALSPALFESELFGHKKGAFTDAREDRIGKVELANGGTLFLDEIGNIPLQLQSKLLSVLQNREVIPIGSNQSVPVDIRLITATNINIQEAVRSSHFREDLLYRINTVEITIPPLRKRVDDIPLLARHFLNLYSAKYRKEKTIKEDTLDLLSKYHWPGNIRELQHAIERAVIMSDDATLSKDDFMLKVSTHVQKEDALNLDDVEKTTIIAAIEKHQGNMSKVAKELGVGRTTLYRKLTKYGLEK